MDAARRKRWAERREYIESHKDRPCEDCGNTYPRFVMDFHHLDEETKDPQMKKKNFIQTAMKWCIERIDAELAKCVVLCSNCHRVRHHA